ncbi:MAG: tetratricopeptide repeat protein [Bacteroidetes bacterium]|nr:tetratricopeptide repeat protein [Bacteroidota bacterium]
MPPFNDTIFLSPYAPIPDHERPLGRDEDLQELTRRLQEAGQLVVVKGLGGIGKSTLARYFVDTHRQQYRHIAWVKVNNGLPAGFSQDTYLHGKLNLDLSQIPHEYDRFIACLNALEKLEGPNLLVLDNAVQDAASQNYRSQLPKAPKWQVLLTSRYELNGYSKMELGRLSNDAARQLFERCYQKPVANETWAEIYQLTDGHALSLELFGKSLHKTLGRLGPEGLVQRLKEKKLNDPVFQQHIASEHSGDETTVYEHLLITFNLSEFGDYTIWLFKQFVALPLIPHRFDDLVALLQIDEEDKDDLHSALLFMEETGWLEREGDGFLMHPMVREVGYYLFKPKDDDVINLVETITTLLNRNEEKGLISEYYSLRPFGESILNNIIWNNKGKLGALQNNLGALYLSIGEFRNSIYIFQKALEITEDEFGFNDEKTITCLSNLAISYSRTEEFSKSIEKLLEARARIEVETESNKKLISSIEGNLGEVYRLNNDFVNAEILLEKSIVRDIELYGKDDIVVARRLNNLGLVYEGQGKKEKGCEILEQALEIILKNLDPQNPLVANVQNNLASAYHKLRHHEKAYELSIISLQSNIKNYGRKHYRVGIQHNNIGWILIDMKLWEKAMIAFQNSFEILNETLGDQHSGTLSCKKGLDIVQAQLSKTTLPKSNLRKKFKKVRLKK